MKLPLITAKGRVHCPAFLFSSNFLLLHRRPNRVLPLIKPIPPIPNPAVACHKAWTLVSFLPKFFSSPPLGKRIYGIAEIRCSLFRGQSFYCHLWHPLTLAPHPACGYGTPAPVIASNQLRRILCKRRPSACGAVVRRLTAEPVGEFAPPPPLPSLFLFLTRS